MRILATTAASAATVHVNEKRKAGINRNLHPPALDPCMPVRRFRRVRALHEKVQVVATSEIAAMSSSGEIWKATATATQPQARRTRGNSTAGNPEAEPPIVRGRVAACMCTCTAKCGHSLDCITAGSFRISTPFGRRECLVVTVADCLCFVRKAL